MTSAQVFLDANALIYVLDETSDQHAEAVVIVQRLLDEGVVLCSSHHVIEEVMHVVRKIGGTKAIDVVRAIEEIPGLVLVEPDAMITFAERYAFLVDKLRMGVNDALLLQLMLDAGVKQLFSYDRQFISRAAGLGIAQVDR